jgi:hypothetical protein
MKSLFIFFLFASLCLVTAGIWHESMSFSNKCYAEGGLLFFICVAGLPAVIIP